MQLIRPNRRRISWRHLVSPVNEKDEKWPFFVACLVRVALQSPALLWLFVASVLAALSGCTSYAIGVKHNRELLSRITAASVLWLPNDKITVHVIRTRPLASAPANSKDPKETMYEYRERMNEYSQPVVVTEEDKQLASNNTRRIMHLFSTRVGAQLEQALVAKKVALRPSGTPGIAEIHITPSSGQTEYVPLGCNDSLWMQVSVLVGPERKEAWSARIRAGTSWPGEIGDVMVKDFADTLTKNLQDSGVL